MRWLISVVFLCSVLGGPAEQLEPGDRTFTDAAAITAPLDSGDPSAPDVAGEDSTPDELCFTTAAVLPLSGCTPTIPAPRVDRLDSVVASVPVPPPIA